VATLDTKPAHEMSSVYVVVQVSTTANNSAPTSERRGAGHHDEAGQQRNDGDATCEWLYRDVGIRKRVPAFVGVREYPGLS